MQDPQKEKSENPKEEFSQTPLATRILIGILVILFIGSAFYSAGQPATSP